MAQTNPQTIPRVTITRAYEKQTCSKKTIVRLKVDNIKMPPSRRITVEIKFSDGTSRTAEALLVSAYTDYAYYELTATDAKEVYPYIDKVVEIKVVGE
jgi:hypothetical protein